MPHQNIGAMLEVGRRSLGPGRDRRIVHVPAAVRGAAPRGDAVHILQPEPLYLVGLWRTRLMLLPWRTPTTRWSHPTTRRDRLRRGRDAARRLHPQLLRAGDVRRVQRRLDADDRGPPRGDGPGRPEAPEKTAPAWASTWNWDRLAGNALPAGANWLPLFAPGWERRGAGVRRDRWRQRLTDQVRSSLRTCDSINWSSFTPAGTS